MKRYLIFLCFIISVILMPICVSAKNTIKDLEPTVNIKGIDKDNYNIEKEITDEFIIIKVLEKDGKLSYSWKFDKNKIKNNTIDLNFEVTYESKNKSIIDKLSSENKDKTYVSFTHHGDLPTEAEISIYVGKRYKENERLYLYYYNSDKKEIEFVENKLKVHDGYVTFHIKHCSDYFLTGAVVNNAVGNPKLLNNIITVLGVFIFILLGIMLFSKK